MKGKVLIAAPVHAVLTNGLTELGYELVLQEKIDQQTAFEKIADCAGVITSTRIQLDKALLDAAPALKWIGRMGSGMEVIDLEYTTAKGIKCFGSPEGNSNAVAEHALGMLLSLTKKIVKSNEEIKQNKWLREENRGIELEGKTIGIIGYGHTGQAFAKKLAGFDMTILAYDKYAPENIALPVIKCDSLQRIFDEADIVSFHVPQQEDTKHYFNNDFIAGMRKPFIFINTSRGSVNDTKALWAGLCDNKITGACMDVWEQEPLEKMDAEMLKMFKNISAMTNVIVTPHVAGYSAEALYKMSGALLSKIVTMK